MRNPAEILTTELVQRQLAFITPDEMTSILNNLGLTLAGGTRQLVSAHLENHSTLATSQPPRTL